MRAVLQRVTKASVAVADEVVGAIDAGLVALVAVCRGDGDAEARWIARKIANLRIFEDDAGRFNRSLLDVGGRVLLVSQFTLYADVRRGRRPSFTEAAGPEVAEELIGRLAASLLEQGVEVESGRFQAHMLVEILNDGPVTVILDKPPPNAGA